jgi:hypothetical protein
MSSRQAPYFAKSSPHKLRPSTRWIGKSRIPLRHAISLPLRQKQRDRVRERAPHDQTKTAILRQMSDQAPRDQNADRRSFDDADAADHDDDDVASGLVGNAGGSMR